MPSDHLLLISSFLYRRPGWVEYGQLGSLSKELQGWDVEKVIPGHGPIAGKDALQKQAPYLEDLRKEVVAAIVKGLSLEDAQKTVIMNAYKNLKWLDLLVPNVIAVFQELKAEKSR